MSDLQPHLHGPGPTQSGDTRSPNTLWAFVMSVAVGLRQMRRRRWSGSAKPQTRGIPLHSFWDGLLGTSGKPQSHLDYAIMIEHEHPRKSLAESKKTKAAKEWCLESRGIAVEKAHLRGELKGGTNKDTAQELPEGYTKAAKVVAERQVALAGYRLADEIDKRVR
jgi:hypothetical protein